MKKFRASILCPDCQKKFNVLINKKILSELANKKTFAIDVDIQFDECPHCGYLATTNYYRPTLNSEFAILGQKNSITLEK